MYKVNGLPFYEHKKLVEVIASDHMVALAWNGSANATKAWLRGLNGEVVAFHQEPD